MLIPELNIHTWWRSWWSRCSLCCCGNEVAEREDWSRSLTVLGVRVSGCWIPSTPMSADDVGARHHSLHSTQHASFRRNTHSRGDVPASARNLLLEFEISGARLRFSKRRGGRGRYRFLEAHDVRIAAFSGKSDVSELQRFFIMIGFYTWVQRQAKSKHQSY